MNRDSEISFVKKKLLEQKDFFGFKDCYNRFNIKSATFEDTINDVLDYCFYSEFNPYLDKEYLDYMWLRNDKNGLIYNIDDMFDVYYHNLVDLKAEELKRSEGE